MKTANPFQNFVPADLFKNLNVPGVDMEALIASQKKNIDAIVEANKLAVEGLQAVAKRQEELVREAVNEIQAAAREVKTPDKLATFTADVAQKALDQTREIGEMVAKANKDVLEVVNKRTAASIAEFKAAVKGAVKA